MTSARLQALVLFLVVLGVSVIAMGLIDRHDHQEIATADRAACLKDVRLAANQRRVILVLYDLVRDRGGRESSAALVKLETALARVPEFDCKEGR